MNPDISRLSAAIEQAHARHAQAAGGANASYIPYLAQVPSHLAAVAAVTVDGAQVAAGDADFAFALESISKICTLVQALEEHGAEVVRKKIGADPTGLPFNSVMALELHKGKPLSPLVNAGAMATVSLLDASDAQARWSKILAIQSALAGAPLSLSEEVNRSEQAATSITAPLPGCCIRLQPCTATPCRHARSIPASAPRWSRLASWRSWRPPWLRADAIR